MSAQVNEELEELEEVMMPISPGDKQRRWYYSFLPAYMAIGITTPALPLFASLVLGATPGEVGLLAALQSLPALPMSILWGIYSDKSGKRRFFISFGFIGLFVALMLMALSGTMLQLGIIAMLLGGLWCASMPSAAALIVETSSSQSWSGNIGLFNRIVALGQFFGLAIGVAGLFVISNDNGLRFILAIASLAALFAFIIAILFIRDSGRIRRPTAEQLTDLNFGAHERYRFMPSHLFHRPFFGRKKRVVRFSRSFFAFVITIIILFCGFVSFYVTLPLFLTDVGMEQAQIFFVYVMGALASVIALSFAGKIVSRIGLYRSLSFAIATRVLVIPLFITVSLLEFHLFVAIALVAVLSMIISLTWSFINISLSLITVELSPEGYTGEGFAFYNLAIGAGTVIGAISGGFFYSFIGSSAYIISALILMCAIVPTLFFRQKLKLVKMD